MSQTNPPSEIKASEPTLANGSSRRLSPGFMALQFLKIGTLGFGGGMAVISLMEHECLRKHRCVEAEEFLHGVGLGQVLGPFAVNAALFIGYRMHGPAGALLAAGAFVAPSVAMVIALSGLYVRFHHLPSLQAALAGIDPVVVALILASAVSMGRKALCTWPTWAVMAAAATGSLGHVHPVILLGVAGAAGVTFGLGQGKAAGPKMPGTSSGMLAGLTPGFLKTGSGFGIATMASSSATVSLGAIGWTFLQVGFAFFGGGFVLIPILHERLVTGLGWLTPAEFVDGVALSQLTPGPIAVLATFAGYRLAGVPGALLATLALFAPAVLLMLLISRFYARLRQEVRVKDFLAGIVPAVVGLIGAAALLLLPGSVAIQRPATVVLAAFSLFVLVRWRWHPAFPLAMGAAVGMAAPQWFG